MQTIYKYPISMTRDVTLNLPEGARIVQVGLDDAEVPCLWALIDPGRLNIVKRKFGVYGTGGRVPDHLEYVGTFFELNLVWHIFEEKLT